MQRLFATGEGLDISSLEADFNRLFAGPGQPLAPPWESYYLNRDHLLFQEETLKIRELYRKYDLIDVRTTNEPDDSLALEFGFVSELSLRGWNATLSSDDAQLGEILTELRDFMNSHLLRWAPDCLHLVLDNAFTGYYRAAANLSLGTLAQTAHALAP